MDTTNNSSPSFRIGILLIDGFAMLSYASTIEPLRAANQLSQTKLYEISHIPVTGATSLSSSGAMIKASAHIGERADYDLVLVVAGGDPGTFQNQQVFNWLRHLSARRIPLGGVSGGPVILASAGLMNNRRMTVHWEHAELLDEYSPPLMLERSLYVIDRDRLTCAGGIAPLDMMHFLISEQHGPEFARQVSDWFMHTDIRPAQDPQRAGLAERYGVNNAPVIFAIEAMTNRIGDTLTLTQLANLANVSPRQLNRLFGEKLQKTTMKFYRDLRLDKARTLLIQSALPATQIALMTGFSSSAHFSSSFKQKFKFPPSTLRTRIN